MVLGESRAKTWVARRILFSDSRLIPAEDAEASHAELFFKSPLDRFGIRLFACPEFFSQGSAVGMYALAYPAVPEDLAVFFEPEGRRPGRQAAHREVEDACLPNELSLLLLEDGFSFFDLAKKMPEGLCRPLAPGLNRDVVAGKQLFGIDDSSPLVVVKSRVSVLKDMGKVRLCHRK